MTVVVVRLVVVLSSNSPLTPPPPHQRPRYLVTKGPLAVSVDASHWSGYSSGVLSYDECGTDIDHVSYEGGAGVAGHS